MVTGGPADRQAFYIRSEGTNEVAVRRGIQWLLDLGRANPRKRSALLAVPARGNLRGVISDVLGVENAKILSDGGTLRMNGVVDLALLTKLKMVSQWDGPVLAVYPARDMLNSIDAISGVTDMLLVPWNIKEVEFWINAWSATELDGRGGTSPAQIAVDATVAEKLASMTSRVNKGTGTAHPRDKATIVRLFQTLRSDGIGYDPEAVRAHLVGQLGWMPDRADEVLEIAKGVLEGRRYQLRV